MKAEYYVVLLVVCSFAVEGGLRGVVEPVKPEKRFNKVHVEVYMRAFCPGCKWFLKNPLLQLMKDQEFSKIVDLILVPAAGMTTNSFEEFQCEGGPKECDGHRYFSCLIELQQTNVVSYLESIACLEDSTSETWKDKVKNCFPDDQFRNKLEECHKDKSTELLGQFVKMEKETNGDWMPYVRVNGKVVGNADEAIEFETLIQDICTSYSGSPELYPSSCEKKTDFEKDERVLVQVAWRAYCPACKWFLTTVVPKLFASPKFADIINFQPLPAAGVKFSADGTMSCTAGPTECDGHKYLSCAISEFPDPTIYAKHLSCLEGIPKFARDDWTGKAKACFKDGDYDKIMSCHQSKGFDLVKEHWDKIQAFGGAKWMPYTLVNGKILGDASHGVPYAELETEVCAAYKGSNIPKECKKNEEGQVSKVEDEAPIQPCKEKKQGETYEDPPDIGGISRKDLLKKKKKQNAMGSKKNVSSSSSSSSMRLPMGLCGIAVMGLIYYLNQTKKRSDKKSSSKHM